MSLIPGGETFDCWWDTDKNIYWLQFSNGWKISLLHEQFEDAPPEVQKYGPYFALLWHTMKYAPGITSYKARLLGSAISVIRKGKDELTKTKSLGYKKSPPVALGFWSELKGGHHIVDMMDDVLPPVSATQILAMQKQVDAAMYAQYVNATLGVMSFWRQQRALRYMSRTIYMVEIDGQLYPRDYIEDVVIPAILSKEQQTKPQFMSFWNEPGLELSHTGKGLYDE